MNCLRDIFEQQIEVRIDSAGNAVIGETVFSPAVILGSDPTAYEAEYNSWLSGQWLPEQDERKESILARFGNRKRFADLCTAVKNEQVVPLVGSGMSVTTGLLTWSDFLRSIRRYSTISKTELERLLEAAAFEKAVDRLAATMPERLFNERIEHDLRLNDDFSVGPICHLPEILRALVLTTNLDSLLEQLYARQGHMFSHVLAGSNISRYRALKAASESFLLKLHGDYRTPEGRVLGGAEYEDAYASDGIIAQELHLIFRTKSILFLGCSLRGDRTVQLIETVAAGDAGMPRHYALLKEPDDSRLIEREHFLAERGIFPIWYPGGHDESIEALLVGVLRHLGRL